MENLIISIQSNIEKKKENLQIFSMEVHILNQQHRI